MEFFGREDDIRELRRIRKMSAKNARFTVVTGRRRVGKTELLYQAFGDAPYVYFLVTRSAEKDLCATFQEEYSRVTVRTLPAPGGKISKYKIEDRFFRYWFRFVWKNQYLVELGRFDRLRELVRRDFDTFSGESLESYFRAAFKESKPYTRMAAWWDRKGENEIDLVCEDEHAGALDFYEVKRDPKRFDRVQLEKKVEAFLEKNPGQRNLRRRLRFVCLDDM